MFKERLLGKTGIDAEALMQRLAFLEWGPDDERTLAALRPLAERYVDAIVEDFYRHLVRFEPTRALLRDPAQVSRLKALQRAYFLRLMDGRLDAEYFESRLRVGDAHQRIGLNPEWYLGSYNLYLRLVVDRIAPHFAGEPGRLAPIMQSLTKVIFLDMGLAIDAYIIGGFVDQALAHEYRRMAEVAERTLREKEALERTKADLTHMIVHDLKAPLGGILTVAQLALRRRGAVADAHARHFEQIQRSARDLMRMIENLLEIDQMEEGRLALRVEPVDVGALLTDVAEEFRAAAEMAGQTLRVEVSDDVSVLAVDRWLLRRVLNNLVVNAIRHSGSGGAVVLAGEPVDGGIAVRVTDHGRGIPAEEQPLLFVKRRTHAKRTGDTGLGLVFCKMAVDIMGGTIEVESAPERGVTFTVTLPV